MKVSYLVHIPMGGYKRIDVIDSFYALSYFISGGLCYFRVNSFEYKTVPVDDIISIER